MIIPAWFPRRRSPAEEWLVKPGISSSRSAILRGDDRQGNRRGSFRDGTVQELLVQAGAVFQLVRSWRFYCDEEQIQKEISLLSRSSGLSSGLKNRLLGNICSVQRVPKDTRKRKSWLLHLQTNG
jgi:hypothetical protein